MTRLYDLFCRGGLLMWPLLALSIAAVAIALERFWTLWREPADAGPTLETLETAFQEGGPPALLDAGQAAGGSVAVLTSAAVEAAADHGPEQVQAAVETAGRDVVGGLEAPLNGLRAIAEVAPLLGFLGTVIGMIQAFDEIVRQGVGDPAVVAKGISTALLTTAAGLSVAVPAYLLHSILSARLDRISLVLERVGGALTAWLGARR